jgi:hypothetical protein
LTHRSGILGGVCLAVLYVSPAFADDIKKPEWWEIIAGIIAIPTGLLGLVVSYATYKKTRLESKKLEFEILEKEKELAKAPPPTAEQQRVSDVIIKPLIDNTRVNYFLLRFILLSLMLLFWTILEKAFGFFVGGAFVTLTQLLGFSSAAATIPMFVLSQIVQLGWVVLVLMVGVPLYRDIAHHIGFRVSWRRFSATDSVSTNHD